ncbi:glycosyltransferase family 4 protein [Colwellia sp. BRX8-4]|uniref:glycosyltransferase family 4 protein n=1 Tax=Colwellia sp. BRX8-4 TaxID=2759836 RepID=UPI0015F69852|nr:glycosyltransferase family 4 protein [Colwellia sp. BRX8-4]MBA6364327.1 glycosyltransferase family 4 protein [Colwellia sp. BRX8-8]MBA6370470.1 glycosyltransferase family 4 protein [Colwellia sp. BRX8-4]
MKVVIFSQFFPPEMEPSGFMFGSLAKFLAKGEKIEKVDVICGFANFPSGKFIDRKWYSLFKRSRQDGVNIHNVIVVPSNNKSNIKRILNYTSYLFTGILKGVFIKSPDVVIATSPPIFAALAGLIVAKLKGAKFVLDVRDIWPESAVQMGSINNKKIISILEWIELLLYKNASLITVATPGMVDIVRSKIPKQNTPIKYIPCGVAIPADNDLERVGVSPFQEIDHGKFCVLYGGLHGHAQNLTTLVDAASLLKKRDDIVFYFIGSGPDKDRVVEYASSLGLSNIKFLSPVTRDEIRRYYIFAGCAIVPLQDLQIFKNVFPSKTFELMSYGVPTVVGVGGEIGKLIESSGAGQSVKPESPEDYSNAIVRYADDESYRNKVSLSAIETAKNSFDYEVVNNEFEELLDSLRN